MTLMGGAETVGSIKLQEELAPLKADNRARRNERINSNKRRISRIIERPERLESEDPMVAIIFDSGAYSIKINHSTNNHARIIPNCIMKAKSERKRLFIGDQIDDCRDCSGLFYLLPCDKGFITKWDIQKPIWDYVFNKNQYNLHEHPIVMTQPVFNFKTIQDCIDEIFFEEYEVCGMVRLHPMDLSFVKYLDEDASNKNDECAIIVDCGYSFTHVVPYIRGKKFWNAIKRINVGGKMLTNHLKDLISYRQYHVMEETFVINQVKEDACYVSENFNDDLMLSRKSSSIMRNYVLPDFNQLRRGYIENSENAQNENVTSEFLDNCQILKLNNERFTVPEILFYPSDIGIKSIGLSHAIYSSIMSCPEEYRDKLSGNIVLTGGSTKFSGFKHRLYKDLRSLLNDKWPINIFQPEDPVEYAWLGGKNLIRHNDFNTRLVTKEQYEEIGVNAVQARFNDWSCAAVSARECIPRESNVNISYIDHIKKYDVFGKGLPTDEKSAEDNSELVESAENLQKSVSSDNSLNSSIQEIQGRNTDEISATTTASQPILNNVQIEELQIGSDEADDLDDYISSNNNLPSVQKRYKRSYTSRTAPKSGI